MYGRYRKTAIFEEIIRDVQLIIEFSLTISLDFYKLWLFVQFHAFKVLIKRNRKRAVIKIKKQSPERAVRVTWYRTGKGGGVFFMRNGIQTLSPPLSHQRPMQVWTDRIRTPPLLPEERSAIFFFSSLPCSPFLPFSFIPYQSMCSRVRIPRVVTLSLSLTHSLALSVYPHFFVVTPPKSPFWLV